MYPWSHPRKLFSKLLVAFAVILTGLALPSLIIDTLGSLYATAWWVPISSDTPLSTWSGGLRLDATDVVGAGGASPPTVAAGAVGRRAP